MIESIRVDKIDVRIHTPKAYESIPDLQCLLYPVITYSVPGKKPRKFSYPSSGRSFKTSDLENDIKTYAIGRSTILLTYSEERILGRVVSDIVAKVRKKIRMSLTRKDFNRRFDKYQLANKKLAFITHLRSVLEEHCDVANLSDVTKVFVEVKNHKVIQSVMET